MMARSPDLFPDAPRRPRRVLMQVVDAGNPPFAGMHKFFVHLVCAKCGHDDDWSDHPTKTASLSQPCPKCNEVAA